MARSAGSILLGFLVSVAVVVGGTLASTALLGAGWARPTLALLVTYAFVNAAAGAAGGWTTARTARSSLTARSRERRREALP